MNKENIWIKIAVLITIFIACCTYTKESNVDSNPTQSTFMIYYQNGDSSLMILNNDPDDISLTERGCLFYAGWDGKYVACGVRRFEYIKNN